MQRAADLIIFLSQRHATLFPLIHAMHLSIYLGRPAARPGRHDLPGRRPLRGRVRPGPPPGPGRLQLPGEPQDDEEEDGLGNEEAVTLTCFPRNDAQNGDVYDGAWVDHDRTGQGVFLGKDGTRYEGGWEVRKRGPTGCFFLKKPTCF